MRQILEHGAAILNWHVCAQNYYYEFMSASAIIYPDEFVQSQQAMYSISAPACC